MRVETNHGNQHGGTGYQTQSLPRIVSTHVSVKSIRGNKHAETGYWIRSSLVRIELCFCKEFMFGDLQDIEKVVIIPRKI